MVRSAPARRLATTLLAIVVSTGVLWWLLGDGEAAALLKALGSASLWPLIFGAMIAIVIQMIRAWRFALLATGEAALPSWTMVDIASRLVLLNFLLPFKLGELGFPVMMKRAYGTPFGEGAGILILCRLLDFGVVAGIILLGAAWLPDPASLGLNRWLVGTFGLLAVIAPLLIPDLLAAVRRIVGDRTLIEQMSLGARRIHRPGRRAFTALLTVAIWLAHAAIAWLTAIAVSADLGFSSMAMASASSNLAFALPVSGVAGLGPPQAAWATALHLQGVDWTPAITTALICHGVLLVTLSIWGVAIWAARGARTTPGEAAGARRFTPL